MPGTIQVGDCVAGRFDIVEILQGGMGVVYVSMERSGGGKPRARALKTLRDDALRDPTRWRRFEAECHLWVRLGKHRNIVRAFAVEELEGRPFVVLEYVVGGELGRWIGTPRLDLPRMLGFGLEFCLGMEQALRAGLVSHRDIKPANLLVTRDGTLKITDFGLVRLRDEIIAAGLGPDRPIPLDDSPAPRTIRWTDAPDLDAEPVRIVSDGDGEQTLDALATVEFVRDSPRPLTTTGWLLGTLPYMAPEQFDDAAGADTRADMYAFGIVLFEMLTGQRPFRGPTVEKFRRQHQHYAPPSIVEAIPRRYRKTADAIDAIVQRCLKKDPMDRYASIVALREALTDALRRVDPTSRSLPPRGFL